MCGRFALITLINIQEFLQIADAGEIQWSPRYNIAPLQDVPVIANHPQLQLEFFRWGLLPHWAKDRTLASKLINARSETLHEKPAFRQSLERRRCLIPASGFYEWQTLPNRAKQPHYFYLKSAPAFAFAGLWDRWTCPVLSETLHTFTIITTPANALLQPIHDRMPAILPPEHYHQWLDPSVHLASDMLKLLRPYPAEDMESHPVTSAVNAPSHDEPELINPADPNPVPKKRRPRTYPPNEQGRLF